MAQDSDILWGLYLENCEQSRHHEGMRATVTNLFLTITAGITAVVALDSRIDQADLPQTLFIVLLGVFGAFVAAKHYERAQMHLERARVFRSALEQLLPTTRIAALKQQADAAHKTKWPVLYDLRLFWFWTGIHMAIALFGVLLTVLGLWFPVIGSKS